MSNYQQMIEVLESASCEEKLKILRLEMLPHVATIQAYISLLSASEIEAIATHKQSNDLYHELAKASSGLRGILDALIAVQQRA